MLKRVVIIFSIASILLLRAAYAQDQNDLYTSTLRNKNAATGKSAKNWNILRWSLGLPAIPVDFLKAGVDPSLVYIEENHIVQKIDWFWKEIKRYGFYPEARFAPGGGIGAGLKLQLDEVFRTNDKLPSLKYDVIAGYAFGGYHDFSGGYEAHVFDNFFQKTRVNYVYSPHNNFFGIGRRTSEGDRSLYSHEEFNIESAFGRKFREFKAEPLFRYRHINIGNGHKNGEFRIKEHFSEDRVPGIHGTDLIDVGLRIAHDTRDHKHDPIKGGYEEFYLAYSNDVNGDNFHYLTLQLRASRFIPLWSDRRVFALNFFAGRSQEVGDGEIPFFDLQRIGGYGSQPRGSELLRGYAYNRFIDQNAVSITPEYRYNIWNYGNFGADSVFFADFGQVFEELHNFGIERFKPSIGAGVRVKHMRDVFFSLEVARGNDGTKIYVRTKSPF